MPPPLNKYVYPCPLFAVQYEGSQLKSMNAKEFTSKCETMKAESHRLAQMQMAVYDLKPRYEIQEEEEEISDDEICEELSDESEIDHEDSDEWEFDDDEPPVE